jgi:hypothetical protein
MSSQHDKGARAGCDAKRARAELRARILAEWANGKYDSEIAIELGLTEGVVHGIIYSSSGPDAERAKADHYRNKALRKPIKRQSQENAERETRVLALWADGNSASAIASKIGVSKSVVIGIVHRSKGENAEAAKRAHAAMAAHRPSATPPCRDKPSALSPQALAERREKQSAAGQAFIAKVELTLIANRVFVAKAEKPFDPYSHMRTERGYHDAIAALSR